MGVIKNFFVKENSSKQNSFLSSTKNKDTQASKKPSKPDNKGK